MRDVDIIIATIADWARTRDEIRALALVGSYARGDARPDSDIDLLLLTTDPEIFRADWLDEIDWTKMHLEPLSIRDLQYGAVWSRHVASREGSEIEFSFAPLSWASIDPVDPGTHRVMANGFRIVHDPDKRLTMLHSVGGSRLIRHCP